MNGWLDPSVVGNFRDSGTLEIRGSLSLEDTPSGIPGATYPLPEDLEIIIRDYPISPGDRIGLEIDELRQRNVVFQASDIRVSSAGYINLPVIGRLPAAGKTVPELERMIADHLRDNDILLDPDVTAHAVYLQKATYSIFGIGASAANNAPLQAGTVPINRPDLRLLEAINLVGGLNDFVTDVYVFRYDEDPINYADLLGDDPPPNVQESEESGADSRESSAAERTSPSTDETARQGEGGESLIRDLLDAVEGAEEPPQPEPGDSEEDLFESLTPDMSDPYIFANGEWVPNPSYRGAAKLAPVMVGTPPSIESTISWARVAGDVGYRIIRVPADALREGDLNANIYVRGGDVIRIYSGEVGQYYVMGQVNRPGAYRFNFESITLKAAIAAASGLSELAWPDRCTIYRRLGRREQMIQVDLDRIFAGKEPDFMIKRNDIINVGTHPLAPFLQIVRGLTLPTPTTNVGYGFTYSRNYADIDSFAVRQNPHNKPDLLPLLFP